MNLTRGKIMSRKNDFERNKGEPFKKPNKTEFLRESFSLITLSSVNLTLNLDIFGSRSKLYIQK